MTEGQPLDDAAFDELVQFLFDDTGELDEPDWAYDSALLVALTTRLFESFAEVARPYKPEQVDQAVWKLHIDLQLPFAFDRVEIEAACQCARAAFHVFADYVRGRELPNGGAFYMWWDCWRDGPDHPEIVTAQLETIVRILALDDRECRMAALHGLNHLYPDPRAGAAVDAFLESHAKEVDPELLDYAKRSRQGRTP